MSLDQMYANYKPTPAPSTAKASPDVGLVVGTGLTPQTYAKPGITGQTTVQKNPPEGLAAIAADLQKNPQNRGMWEELAALKAQGIDLRNPQPAAAAAPAKPDIYNLGDRQVSYEQRGTGDKYNQAAGIYNRPNVEGSQDQYLPQRPVSVQGADQKELRALTENWYNYYKDNPDLRKYLSLDERTELNYLDYATGGISKDKFRTEHDQLRAESPYGKGVKGNSLKWKGDIKTGTGDPFLDVALYGNEIGGYNNPKDQSSAFDKFMGVAAPIVALGANFIPGVGPLTSALISSGLTAATGGSTKDTLLAGVASYAGGKLPGLVSPALSKAGVNGVWNDVITGAVRGAGTAGISGGDMNQGALTGGLLGAINSFAPHPNVEGGSTGSNEEVRYPIVIGQSGGGGGSNSGGGGGGTPTQGSVGETVQVSDPGSGTPQSGSVNTPEEDDDDPIPSNVVITPNHAPRDDETWRHTNPDGTVVAGNDQGEIWEVEPEESDIGIILGGNPFPSTTDDNGGLVIGSGPSWDWGDWNGGTGGGTTGAGTSNGSGNDPNNNTGGSGSGTGTGSGSGSGSGSGNGSGSGVGLGGGAGLLAGGAGLLNAPWKDFWAGISYLPPEIQETLIQAPDYLREYLMGVNK